MRTHTSDAVGYLIAREFPMRAPGGERGGDPLSNNAGPSLAGERAGLVGEGFGSFFAPRDLFEVGEYSDVVCIYCEHCHAISLTLAGSEAGGR